ncbi:hypothetical protein HW090_00635 [Pseudomonas sp. ABC1]|uniref:hypothetical protein n=1 Tax=Pseudomonas sp. ABC1 TaxID=2748080 RepID=UPI0015C33F6E|nr:hypothetical protein [Pseudomonas sp. ABC1]QLF91791.1 hypothetical protein HW090_00635 [Pseudomonas sp. ABC1]
MKQIYQNFKNSIFVSALGFLSACAGPPASQSKAEANRFEWSSVKSPIEISECVSQAWESMLIPNFVFVRPLIQGYRIDKTSDLGHLYLSAEIRELPNSSQITVWITNYVWLQSQQDDAKNAVISCL